MMAKPRKLYRTEIVIWTDFDPSNLELDDLAREAVSGGGYCSKQLTVPITNMEIFPDTEFFDDMERE